MTAVLQEYGLLIISAMAVGGFFVIFTVFMGSEEADVSARRIYKGNQLWANQGYTEGGGETSFEVLFNDEADMNNFYGMTDVITNASKTSIPFFIVSDSKDYIFRPVSTGTKVYNGINIPTHADTIKVTRDRLLEGVDCYYYDSSGQKVALNKNDITVLVTYYEYQIAYNEDTLAPTGVPQVEEVQAVDMFGNPIFNADGSPQIVTRYLYSVNPGTDDLRLESDFEGYGTNCDKQFLPDDGIANNGIGDGIEISADTAYKIKVIYRIEHGTMKAEYTALFSNKIRPQYQRADWMFDQVFDNTNEERDPVTGQNVLSLEGYSLRPESIESDYVVVPEYEPTVTQIYTNGEDASNPDNNPNKSEDKSTETPKEEPKVDNEEKTNVDNSNDDNGSDSSDKSTDTTDTSSSSSSSTGTTTGNSSSSGDSGADTSNTSSSEPRSSEPTSEQSGGTTDGE